MAIAPYRFIGGMATDNSYTDATSRNWYRIDDVEEQISHLNSQGAVFYKILDTFRRGSSVMQPKYSWWNDDVPAILTNINFGAGYNTTDATLVVDDTTIFTPRTLVLNQRTQELMIVNSLTDTTTIVVERGVNGTDGVAILDNDGLMALGAGLPEKGTANLANSQLPVSDWNYVSYFSIKKQVTELQEKTDMRFRIDFPKEMRNGWFELQRQVNQQMLWGRKGTRNDATYGRFYYTDGFITQLHSNILDLSEADGILTWPMFNDYFRNTSKDGASSPTKTLICGTSLFAACNQISYNQASPTEYMETLGTSVKRIETDEGLSVDIVLDRYSFPETHAGMGIVVDLNQVELKAHAGLEFQVRPNIQDNDAHLREDEIYGSASLQVKHEEVHGLIQNCVGPY